MEMWSGNVEPDDDVYLSVPVGIDVDKWAANDPNVFHYGENAQLLIDKLVSLGAVIVPNPIQTIYV